MFSIPLTPVLVDLGKKITMGNIPHRCTPIEIPKFPAQKQPPMVRCVSCGEQVSPRVASLCVTNWICHKCRPV